MTLFFNCIDTLHQLTLNLKAHPERFRCPTCQRTDQFVSHGFVYKKQHGGDPIPVGKRLFCANRHGRSGCGATLQLYLSTNHPRLHHSTLQIQLFVLALLANTTITEAYRQATGTDDARNAYRWRDKCLACLSSWRALLPIHSPKVSKTFTHRVRWLRLVLPTLATLQCLWGNIAAFHHHLQQPFLG